MSTFTEAVGRNVVSRDDAEARGSVSHLAVDGASRRVTGIVIGSGRKADAYWWDQVVAFGPDAVIIEGKPLDGDRATEVTSGDSDPMGKRLLTDRGEHVGSVTDVDFDESTAEIRWLRSDQGHDIPAAALRGVGSYAVVVAAPDQ